MQAILFTSGAHECEPLIAGLRSQHIFIQMVSSTDHEYKRQLLSQTNFFFFHREIREDDLPFIRLLKCLKPMALTILLDPIDPTSLDMVDLAFTRPYSYALISLHIQKKLVEKRDQYCPRDIRAGNLVLHLQRRALIKDDIIIPLKNKEFALIHYFFINGGKIVSRADILEYVWDRNTSMTTNTVDVHVSRLRTKLKLCDADRFLQTVPCVGYVWACDAT